MRRPRGAFVLGVAGAAVVAGAYALRAAGTLVIDGRGTPADVRTIGGVPYVRLSDVARAMGRTVAARGGGRYELTVAGGANGIGGAARRVGDTIFDGKWRFTVLGVDLPAAYTMRPGSSLYNEGDKARQDRTTRVVTPGSGYELVVVRVRVANGTKGSRRLLTSMAEPKVHTALADADGSTHVPIGYDYGAEAVVTPPMLPGAAMTFGVVFSIPLGTTPKDLIFTLRTIDSDDKGTDVRVSLQKGQ